MLTGRTQVCGRLVELLHQNTVSVPAIKTFRRCLAVADCALENQLSTHAEEVDLSLVLAAWLLALNHYGGFL